MTDEDINKIAKEYADWLARWFPEIKERNKYRDKMSQAKNVIRLILRDYAIVPKEFIRKEYEEAHKTHDVYTSATCINEMESRAIDHAAGRMYELTSLFGRDFFEKGE